MTSQNQTDLPWWKKTTVYQIYPRSFKDSNDDGIGDLKGIISKLDYIKDLGVETIWFSPFYESPTDKPYKYHDCGYDIKNYRGINPEYGDMATTEELINQIHARGMKVVFDMVLNHTSIEHPWFVESRSSKENPKRNWYIWREGKKPTKKMPGGSRPPNNWRAMIMGSGWQYDKTTDQYYWHQFLKFQPDLNYRNPEVVNEMLDTMRFWLKKGVDGFRLDIVNALFEDAEFRDNPRTLKIVEWDFTEAPLFQKQIHTINHPDTLEFMKTLRKTIDEFNNPPRFMVGEVSAPMDILRKFQGENEDGLNLVFVFQCLTTPFKPKPLKKLINTLEEKFPHPIMPTLVFGNHDRTRRIQKLGGSISKAKLNTAFQMTARGVPFIYNGEEIGMENIYTKKKDSTDALIYHFKWIPEFILKLVYKLTGESLARDGCRTPIQWDDSANAGFSTEKCLRTWLPIPKSYKKINVKANLEDPDSLLHCYQRFLKARKGTPALNSGSLRIINFEKCPKSVLVYERKAQLNGKEQIAYVFLNFSKKSYTIPNPLRNSKFLVSTHINSNPIAGNRLIINSWEGFVLLDLNV